MNKQGHGIARDLLSTHVIAELCCKMADESNFIISSVCINRFCEFGTFHWSCFIPERLMVASTFSMPMPGWRDRLSSASCEFWLLNCASCDLINPQVRPFCGHRRFFDSSEKMNTNYLLCVLCFVCLRYPEIMNTNWVMDRLLVSSAFLIFANILQIRAKNALCTPICVMKQLSNLSH